MKVEVTQEDIDKGGRWMAERCPVARALRREVGGAVGVSGGYWIKRTGNSWIALPKKVFRWTQRFDMGRPVKPFTFTTRRPK
jgi:hypothetical protein